MADSKKDDKIYDYNEAIELAGTGSYNIGLLIVLSMSLLFMCVDLFSFSVVISFYSCDTNLDIFQKSLLVSIPFMGPVIMAYAWGYISDTKGRRKSLLIAMSVSFLMSTLCSFASNWIVLAFFKLVGTCFVSCAQSASFTLLGESCPERVKGTYLLFMTSTVHLGSSIYFALGYLIGNLSFSYDLGLITFVPWRLLNLTLALPLGLCAIGLLFFYESPKFLLNAGKTEEALIVLRNICRRNGGDDKCYPVEKLVLNEEGNVTNKDASLLKSMWEQTAPLFRPPLLLNTLLLYYIIFVVYSTNSGLYIWLPFLAKAFTASTSSSADEEQGLCSLISISTNTTTTTEENVTCKLDSPIVVAAVTYGSIACIINLFLSKFASRRKGLMFWIITASTVSCLGTRVIPYNFSSFLYFGSLISSMCLGPVSSYYVDLYPTSFRGMAGCLGVMVGRLSSVIGINVIGPFLMSHCSTTFYSITAILLTGIFMVCFLPPDKPKKILPNAS